MARKNTSKPTESAPVVAPVVETVSTPVVEAAPVVVDKAPKVKKAKAPKVETVVAPIVETVSTPVVEEPVLATESKSALTEQSVEFIAKLQQLSSLISSLKSEYKTLEKEWTRELKVAQKQSSKRKRKAGNRAPSGFVKPTRISDELAKFLEKPVGTEMARTDVTREINTYIRAHKLQDKDNGRKINPDAKLTKLLKISKDDELTYFNLQKFMKHHFVKAEVAATA